VGNRPWVHLDIAGPARAPSDDGYLVKGGTGFGVRTLLELVSGFEVPSGAVSGADDNGARPKQAAAPKKAAAGKTAAKKTAARKAATQSRAGQKRAGQKRAGQKRAGRSTRR